jgi:hypothetical protein
VMMILLRLTWTLTTGATPAFRQPERNLPG